MDAQDAVYRRESSPYHQARPLHLEPLPAWRYASIVHQTTLLWVMKRSQIVAAVVFLSLVAVVALAEPDSSTDQGTQREKFDPTRDPVKDVAAAVASASKSGQRILLDVGGEWCPWCRKLDGFFGGNPDVATFLHKNFVVVKVNFSKENQNEKFLSQYPTISGYPHLFVLDSNGKLLHSQSTGELENGDHHDHDKVFSFLKKWAPSPRRS